MLKSREELDAELGGAARTWLDEALAEAAHDAATPDAPGPYTSPPWELRYAAAGRHCGREHADSVRSLLLVEARATLPSVTRLYEQGAAAERRAVLLTLHRLDLGDTALPLVEDALRANDTRLVAAAVGPYAADHLDPHAWRHAVLKCLFTEVPITAVARLGERATGDAELARMLGDFAAERTAAGRAVPEDLRTVLGHVRRIRTGSTTPGTALRGVADTPESLRDEDVPAPRDAPHQAPGRVRPSSTGHALSLTAPAGEGAHQGPPTAAPAAPAPTEES